jgi:hypothetical protein
MGTVKDFAVSGDTGWEVTNLPLTELLQEIALYPSVIIVIKGTQTYLINRTYIRVKVVTNERGDSEQNGEQTLTRNESGNSQ